MRVPTVYGSGTLNEGEHELFMQSNINIANSINEDTQKQIIEKISMINKLSAPPKVDAIHQPLQHKMSSGQSTVVI